MNCLEGELLPITVNGSTPNFTVDSVKDLSCDKPPILKLQDGGQCVPYARIQRVPSYDPDVLTVLNCRHYNLRSASSDHSSKRLQ